MARQMVMRGRRPDRTDLTPEYRAFMASEAWREIRRDALAAANYACERCGAVGLLEVHHLTYERFGGDELLDDLEVLCTLCHIEADVERKEEVEQRAYERRLDGWASKVYGDHWRVYHNEAVVEQEFDDWLEKRGDG